MAYRKADGVHAPPPHTLQPTTPHTTKARRERSCSYPSKPRARSSTPPPAFFYSRLSQTLSPNRTYSPESESFLRSGGNIWRSPPPPLPYMHANFPFVRPLIGAQTCTRSPVQHIGCITSKPFLMVELISCVLLFFYHRM